MPRTGGWAIFSIALRSSKREFAAARRTNLQRQSSKRHKATTSNLPHPQTWYRLNFRSLQNHRLKHPSCRKCRLRRILFCRKPHHCQFPPHFLSQVVSSRRRASPSNCPRIKLGGARFGAAAPRSAEFADCSLGGRTRRDATGCGGFRQQGQFHCGGSPGGPGRGPGARRPPLARRYPQCST